MLLKRLLCVTWLAAALAMTQIPLSATVTITSMTPSVVSPQPLGTPVTWTVSATDSNPSRLVFQFSVAFGSQPFSMASDFNIGTLAVGTWTAQPLVWSTIAGEGVYTVQAIAKDVATGETATQTAAFTLTALASTQTVVQHTANPLVALFSAPSCAAGSSARVAYSTGPGAASFTSWAPCNPPLSMNFYVAGMMPGTAYAMYSQVQTGAKMTNSKPINITTGPLPASLPRPEIFPKLTVKVPAGGTTDTADSMLLLGFTKNVVPVATDLAGNIMWYYPNGANTLVTRPLAGGTMLTFQDGLSWSSNNQQSQMLREIDLAGNVIRETNTGALSQQLVAMGGRDAGSCLGVSIPAPVGTTCVNEFSHDAIRFSVGGADYTALLLHVEKMFPPGTQGSNPNGPPVDILTEMLVVLDAQWQVVWYYDSMQQLDLNRAAVLGETCGPHATGCVLNLTLATVANDWTHGNTIYYIPSTGDFMVSLRDQDWLIKINYANGAGAGNILWRMGPDGDFTFVNKTNDPWPWFSHQHDAGFENNGAGPLTIFDNGNTRRSPPPLGLGSNCGPRDCNSRGMSLTVDETKMQVTPVLSDSLAVYAIAVGSAQLLADGNYFFLAGVPSTQAIEVLPTAGSLSGTQVLNISSPSSAYRGWQLPNLYAPPTT